MTDEDEGAGPRAGGPAAGARTTRSAVDGSNLDEAAARSARSRVALNPQIRNRLAAQLRAMYDTIVEQPVPDRFTELIAKFDSGDREVP